MRTQIEFQTKNKSVFFIDAGSIAKLDKASRWNTISDDERFGYGSFSVIYFFPFLIGEDKLRCLLLVFIGIRRLRIKLIFIRWSFLDPGGKLFWQTNNIFGPQKKAFGASEAFNWIENKFLTKICWLMLAIFCQMFCNDFFQLLFFSAGRWK